MPENILTVFEIMILDNIIIYFIWILINFMFLIARFVFDLIRLLTLVHYMLALIFSFLEIYDGLLVNINFFIL